MLPARPAAAQTRQKWAPLRGVSAPVEIIGPFEGGTELVRTSTTFDLDEVNEFLGVGERTFSLFDGIEKLLDLRSPAPTTHWGNFATAATAGAGGLIDPQIAASNSVVAVLTWDTLGWYDKSGGLLPITSDFPNPTNTETLFKPLVDWLDQHANLNPDVAGDASFLFANGQVGDARIAPR